MDEQEIIRIATDTYRNLGTQFGVAKVPVHTHNGVDTVNLPVQSISGYFQNVTSAPTWTPTNFSQAFAIDTTNKIFYVYDFTNNAWLNFANKTKRVQSVTDAATVTPNVDAQDCVDITALAQAVTIAAPTGTPTNFQTLIIRFKDNGTARAITWNAAFVAGGVALPSTTVISKILTVGFFYNTANSLNKWQCVASAQEA